MINYDLNKIKALVFDVDGVLSRQTINLDASGEPARTVNTKDGYALQYAVKQGLKIAIITGARTESIKIRYNKLGIEDVFLAAQIKIDIFQDWAKKNNLKPEEILYMGDDIPDLCLFPLVALSCAPSDASVVALKKACWVSRFPGGHGAVRELAEFILKSQGRFEEAVMKRFNTEL